MMSNDLICWDQIIQLILSHLQTKFEMNWVICSLELLMWAFDWQTQITSVAYTLSFVSHDKEIKPYIYLSFRYTIILRQALVKFRNAMAIEKPHCCRLHWECRMCSRIERWLKLTPDRQKETVDSKIFITQAQWTGGYGLWPRHQSTSSSS